MKKIILGFNTLLIILILIMGLLISNEISKKYLNNDIYFINDDTIISKDNLYSNSTYSKIYNDYKNDIVKNNDYKKFYCEKYVVCNKEDCCNNINDYFYSDEIIQYYLKTFNYNKDRAKLYKFMIITIVFVILTYLFELFRINILSILSFITSCISIFFLTKYFYNNNIYIVIIFGLFVITAFLSCTINIIYRNKKILK